MELTRTLVSEAAAEYDEREPFVPVEVENVETLPEAFREGEFGFRDAEWVVQWFYRRPTGEYSNREIRQREGAFAANERQEVRRAVTDAATGGTLAERIDRLCELEGVALPVASAFLFFSDTERYIVVGPREWGTLHAAGEVEGGYPNPPTLAEYERYLERCRSLGERFDCDMWTLYRGLWRLGSED
ncbi:hypothetical protein [Natronorarus salvus]|uniref:hypothetical protein n=1 Tax=Natronorarus salvus TaxID=3117733 RepID=UPI002F2675F1